MKKSIAIIGGGFTGLTAGYQLSKYGYKVTIIEASSAVGGLASGFKINNKNIEKAYHFVYQGDLNTKKLLKELNIDSKLHFFPSSISTYYDKKLFSMMSPIDLLRFTPLSFFDRLRAGATALFLQLTTDPQKLADITAIKWLNKWAGRNVTKVIWEPLLKGKFDKYYKDISMGWLWGRIKQRMESQSNGKEMLGYLEDGFVQLSNSLCKQIKLNDGDIFLNSPVKNIEQSGDESKYTIYHGESDISQFDNVLFTTSNKVFQKIMASKLTEANSYVNKINSIEYLNAMTLVFSSKQKITDFYWHNINVDNSFVVFLCLTNLIGQNKFSGDHIYYIGDYMAREQKLFYQDEKDIKERWFDDLKRIFPHFDASMIKESHLFKFTDAQHIVGTNYESKIPEYVTPIKGIYLSNFSQIYPMDRGINFAIEEGFKVAKLIDQNLK